MESSTTTESGIERDQGNQMTPCVPELVRRRTMVSPEAFAVGAGSHRLTYAELDRRSDQLAYFLRGLGVGPGNVVAVCLERSVDFPVAALAILKAGAAYLALDTKTPVERLKLMLETAQVSVV